MLNYSKTKVYKIWSPNGDKIYIGVTSKEYLSQRMDEHRSKYKGYLKSEKTKKNTTSILIFEEYGVENCFIELIEAKECTSKDEQNKLEGKYIRELNCVNRCISGRSYQEWRDQYYSKNQDKILIQNKQYYKDNQDKILIRKKQYYEDNKDKLSIQKKQYYEDNKDKINERRTLKTICGCGSEFRHCAKSRHERTNKHINFIEQSQ